MKAIEESLPLTDAVEPASEQELCQLVRSAANRRVPLYPVGGGTMLRYGAAARRPGRGVGLHRLDRVVDYPAHDLTITVEAGLTVAGLARRLAKNSQHLPVDVPMADRATVGGVVAANPSGPRQLGWGTLRDYVIALRAVDGLGQPFSAGARVVKNAAGYNLCRLLTGSLGTLGVITQVTFMVRPAPAQSALVACRLDDFPFADRLLAGLADTRTSPVAAEVLAGPLWEEVPELSGAEPGEAGRMVVGFEGTEREVGWMVEQLQREWAGLFAAGSQVIADRRARRLWAALTEFPWGRSEQDGPAVVTEIRVRPSDVLATMKLLLETDPGCSIQSHAASGVLRVRHALDAEPARAAIVERLRPAVAARGGSLVVLDHPDGEAWDRTVVWGSPPPGFKAMEAIKRQFDPQGILNPDRFIFGGP